MTDMKISQTNDELKLRAHAVLPGGHFGNMASDIVITKGKEARIWDSQGNEYVDFLLGSGPMFIGHAHPKVTEAVLNQVPNGTTFFANNEHKSVRYTFNHRLCFWNLCIYFFSS